MFFKGSLLTLVIAILTTALVADQALAEGQDNPFFIRINIPARRLDVFMDGKLIKEYPVAVGKPATPSQTGYFKIVNKVVNPTWYPEGRVPVEPGPDNPVGTRWLGLNLPGYGIHGTNNPSSIGRAVSGGCFRMYNWDIEELYDLVPKGTPVHLTYEPVEVTREPGGLAPVVVRIHPDLYNLKPPTLAELRELVRRAGYPGELPSRTLQELLNGEKDAVLTLPETYKAEFNGIVFDHRLEVKKGRLQVNARALARLLGVQRVGFGVFAWLLEHGWKLKPEVAAELFDLAVSLDLATGRLKFAAPIIEYPDGRKDVARVDSTGRVKASSLPFTAVFSVGEIPYSQVPVVIGGRILHGAAYRIGETVWVDLIKAFQAGIGLTYECRADDGRLLVKKDEVREKVASFWRLQPLLKSDLFRFRTSEHQ
ncbi:MAG: L,D-transpeptidase [Firmicutes bacterium]|nr:L,D-transpeptidase [Bacillota bacterium]